MSYTNGKAKFLNKIKKFGKVKFTKLKLKKKEVRENPKKVWMQGPNFSWSIAQSKNREKEHLYIYIYIFQKLSDMSWG